jgi:hypothetical protein
VYSIGSRKAWAESGEAEEEILEIQSMRAGYKVREGREKVQRISHQDMKGDKQSKTMQ